MALSLRQWAIVLSAWVAGLIVPSRRPQLIAWMQRRIEVSFERETGGGGSKV